MMILAVGALPVRRGHVRSVVVDDLQLGRLRVGELVVDSGGPEP